MKKLLCLLLALSMTIFSMAAFATEITEDDLRSMIVDAYMGIMEGDEEITVYLGMGDGWGVIIFLSENEEEYICYTGAMEIGDKQFAIEDEENGIIVLSVEQAKNGFILEWEGVGTIKVGQVEVDELIEALIYIDANATPQKV